LEYNIFDSLVSEDGVYLLYNRNRKVCACSTFRYRNVGKTSFLYFDCDDSDMRWGNIVVFSFTNIEIELMVDTTQHNTSLKHIQSDWRQRHAWKHWVVMVLERRRIMHGEKLDWIG